MSRPIVLTSPMDGSPQVVRFDATTLWHFDAAEWAPSTASKADFAPSLDYVRFAPEGGHRAPRLACQLCADCVAKVFFAFGRETLIQDRARTSNNDSKEPTLRFDCYKFLFHRACLATFATQSARTGLMRRNKNSIVIQ